jgi:hypothetical protein
MRATSRGASAAPARAAISNAGVVLPPRRKCSASDRRRRHQHQSPRRPSRSSSPPSLSTPSALPALAELAALTAGAEEQLQAALAAVAAAAAEAEAVAADPSLAAGDGRAAISAFREATLDAGAAALPAAVDGFLGPLWRFFAADVAGTVSFPPRPDSALRIGVRTGSGEKKRALG